MGWCQGNHSSRKRKLRARTVHSFWVPPLVPPPNNAKGRGIRDSPRHSTKLIQWQYNNFWHCHIKADKWVGVGTSIQVGSANFMRAWYTSLCRLATQGCEGENAKLHVSCEYLVKLEIVRSSSFSSLVDSSFGTDTEIMVTLVTIMDLFVDMHHDCCVASLNTALSDGSCGNLGTQSFISA